MKSKKILNKYSPKKIEEAIKICDNLFYGKYLETGELKTRAELQQHIKDEVTHTFVQFWGDEYADILIKKIADTRINFVYQIDGPANSVNGFLGNIKTKRFNERYHTEYEAPVMFKHVAKSLNQPFRNPVKILQTTANQEEIPFVLDSCFKQLKIDTSKVVQDQKYAKSVVDQIKILGKQVDEIKYSDNPEVHKNILSLENLVGKVEKNMERVCKRKDIKLYDALYIDNLGLELDPLVVTNGLDENVEILLREQEFLGLQTDDKGVYFCTNPDDDTLLHEFVHQVDEAGFEKHNKDWVKATYSDKLRQNEMFNEIITDYFSTLMKEQRRAEGRPCIINAEGKESLYSELFVKMGKFLDAYLPELKAVRLRKYPAEEFKRIIGQNNFNVLAMICNELIALKHDQDVFVSLQENDEDLNDVMDQGNNVYLYGSVDFFMTEMAMLINTADKVLDKTMRKALAKQPLAKKIDLFLAAQSEKIAGRLQENKNPKLRSLASVFVNAEGVFKDKAKNVAIKKLKEPLQSNGLKEPLLIEHKQNLSAEENVAAMGK